MTDLLPFCVAGALTAFQLLCVLLLAPFLSGLRLFFSAKLAGRAAPPVLRHGYVVARLWREPLPAERFSDAPVLPDAFVPGLVAPVALALALCAALLVPAFSLGLATAPWSDLLLIVLLLAFARLLTLLPALGNPAETAFRAYRQAVAQACVLPSLFLVVLLMFSAGASTGLDGMLAGLRSGNPFVEGAPFVLAGIALLAAVERTGDMESGGEGQGRDRAMLLLACDLLALTWLTLAGDLIWPGLLTRVGSSAGFLPGLGALALGTVCWAGRSVLLAVLLTAGRAVPLGRTAATRLRATAAALLVLLALQLLTASHLMPERTDDPPSGQKEAAP